MNIRVGHVICRQLGYSGAEQISQRAEFWPLKGPLWIYSITCNGNETNISQCAFTTFDGGHRYFYDPRDAGAVICTETRVGVSRGGYFLKTVNTNLANYCCDGLFRSS